MLEAGRGIEETIPRCTALRSRTFPRRLGRLLRQKFPEEFQRIGVHGAHDADELHDVNPALATFVFGNKGLRLSELFGQSLLANARLLSHCDKQRDQAGIFCGFERFFHDRRAGESAARNLILTTDYPKKG